LVDLLPQEGDEEMIDLTPTWKACAIQMIRHIKNGDKMEKAAAEVAIEMMAENLDQAIQFLKDQGFDPRNLQDPKAK